MNRPCRRIDGFVIIVDDGDPLADLELAALDAIATGERRVVAMARAICDSLHPTACPSTRGQRLRVTPSQSKDLFSQPHPGEHQ
jgi:hypothetical protein